MKRDQKFEPKLGKIRQQKPGKSRRVLGEVARAINTAGGKKNSSGNATGFQARRNSKSLIRGAGSGGGARARKASSGQRRVVIKARIVRIAGRGLGAMKAHLNYIQRDGVTREGDKGQMYGPENDEASAKDFASTCENDRHQFRFIVAPEDGEKLADLKPFVRDLMCNMETDLDTKLDWVAVDHFNTGHPHSHIVVRGKTDRGDDLVIARDYISHGLRARAAELVTLELGPKTDVEQVQDWRKQVTAERFTGLDQELIRKSAHHQVKLTATPKTIVERVRGDLLVQRLKQLEAMQLATEISKRQWQLSPNLEATLRHLGERGDIIKTMHRALKAQQLERNPQSWQIDGTNSQKIITGKIIERGLSDEHRDRHYLIVDGIDGRVHYVDAGMGTLAKDYRRGALVEIAPAENQKQTELNPEMTRRKNVQRVILLSRWSLDDQTTADGVTWLDRQLIQSKPDMEMAQTGFGSEVRQALKARQRWLLAQGLAEENHEGGTVTVRANPRLLETLKNRDLNRAATALAKDTGMDVEIARKDDAISGTLLKKLDLVSGRFAVIDQSQSRGLGLTIAPWSPALETARNRQISGVMIGAQMRWSLGKDIGMEIG
jgi:type IV secretory pathway VirD2 relaxase